MSKKKKKTVPVSGGEKIKQSIVQTAGRGYSGCRRLFSRIDTFLCAAGDRICEKTTAFMRLKWSAVPLTLFFMLLLYVTYLLFGHRYLSANFPLTFPFALPFYLTDFSAGFISRALVGQVITLFTKTLSVMQILFLSRGVIVAVWAAEAAIAAGAFKKAWLNNAHAICILCFFFVFSPVASVAFQIFLGFLDPYNILLAVLYFYISDTKAAPLITPIICVTGVILHYQFILALLPFILTVELYYICRFKKNRVLRSLSLAVSITASAAVGVYLIFFSKYNLTMDADAFYNHMCEKFTDYKSWGLFKEYFTFYIYGDYDGNNYSAPADFIRFLLRYSIDRVNPRSLLGYAAAMLPAFSILEYFWFSACRRCEKERKLPYIVFILYPLVFAAGVIASTDTARFAGNAWFSNFALLFVSMRHDGDLIYPAAAKLRKFPRLLLLCMLLLAAYIVGLISMHNRLN